jgi:hypothetical protein
MELRSALAEAYVASGLTPPTYASGAVAVGATILATHVAEVRAAVLGIW